MKVKLIIWAILLILVAILIWNNAGTTELRFFFKTFRVSQIVIILVSLIIGFVAGLLVEGRKKVLPKKITKSEEE
ncbi:DUF1049 domain-containing protein [candidate division WOR-3 bacterium]|nr:DUF1049 domain-containing protein [candidate division WOR-3 bacterium]